MRRRKLKTLSSRTLNAFAVVGLMLSLAGSAGLYNFISDYMAKEARIPRALDSAVPSQFPPAADTTPATNPIMQMPSSLNDKLATDLATFRKGKSDTRHVQTLSEDRTANDTMYKNADGTTSLVHSFEASNYKDKNGNWQTVDMSLVQDKANGTWHSKANSWQVRFGDTLNGYIQIDNEGQTFSFAPVSANNVKPDVTGTAPNQIVTYHNVWQGVDLQYKVAGSELKESILVDSSSATNNYSFAINGSSLIPDSSIHGAYSLSGAFAGFTVAAPTVVLANSSGIDTKAPLTSSFSNGRLQLSLDKDWLSGQPASAFPITIDPTITTTGINPNFVNVDRSTGGVVCTGPGCGNAVGVDATGDAFRFAYQIPITVPTGNYLVSAKLHVQEGTGNTTPRTIAVDHANCQNAFNCYDGAWGESTGTVASNSSPSDIDVSTVYRNAIAAGNLNPWMMVHAVDETTLNTAKIFDDSQTTVQLNFEVLPSGFTMDNGSPTDGGVSISTQPTFFTKTSSIVDSDGPNLYQYRFIVGTVKSIPTTNPFNVLPSVGGIVADSGRLPINQWTAPNNVLQDGTTYY